MHRSLKTAFWGAIACVLTPSLYAQTSTWTGGGADVSWTTAGNWGGTALRRGLPGPRHSPPSPRVVGTPLGILVERGAGS